MSSKNRRKKPPQVRHPARARRTTEREPAFPQDQPAATGPLSQLPQPLITRPTPEVCEGRLYMATSTLRLSGESIDFDFALVLHALAEGKLTGEAADVASEAVTAYIEEAALPLPGLDGTSMAALLDSTRRLIADGFLGSDHNGGYITVPSLAGLSR